MKPNNKYTNKNHTPTTHKTTKTTATISVARSNSTTVKQQIQPAPKNTIAGTVLATRKWPNIAQNYNIKPLISNVQFGGIPPPKLWQGTG